MKCQYPLLALTSFAMLTLTACGGKDAVNAVDGEAGPCVEGEITSDGLENYICAGGQWNWASCVEGAAKNDETYSYSCQGGQWAVIGFVNGNPGEFNSGCQEGQIWDSFVCSGGQWIAQTVPEVPNIPSSGGEGSGQGTTGSGTEAGSGTGTGSGSGTGGGQTTNIDGTICGSYEGPGFDYSQYRDNAGIKYHCEPVCYGGGFCEPEAVWKPFMTNGGHACKTTDYFVSGDPEAGIPDHCINIVTVGGKTWMAEDLPMFDNLTTSTIAKWYFAMGFSQSEIYTKVPDGQIVQGVCPSGWHIPTVTEWRALMSNSANASAAGICSTCDYWSSVQTGGDPMSCSLSKIDEDYCSDFLVNGDYDEKEVRCVK